MQRTLTFILLFLASHLIGQTDRPALQFSLNTLGMGAELKPFAKDFGAASVQTFAGPAIGLLLPKQNGEYTALELSGFLSDENIGNFQQKNSIIALRYEKGFYLPTKKADNPLRLRLGGLLKFAYGYQELDPLTSQVFRRTYHRHTLVLSLTPHFEYRAGKRLFFDIGPTIGLLAFGFEQSRVENPAFTKNQQERNGFALEAGGFMLRLGIGVRI